MRTSTNTGYAGTAGRGSLAVGAARALALALAAGAAPAQVAPATASSGSTGAIGAGSAARASASADERPAAGEPYAADAMQMRDRGRIAVGYNADLVLVHENGEFPRVRGTLRCGLPIYWDSHLASVSELTQLFTLKTASPLSQNG
jgi:hypothetical protein